MGCSRKEVLVPLPQRLEAPFPETLALGHFNLGVGFSVRVCSQDPATLGLGSARLSFWGL